MHLQATPRYLAGDGLDTAVSKIVARRNLPCGATFPTVSAGIASSSLELRVKGEGYGEGDGILGKVYLEEERHGEVKEMRDTWNTGSRGRGHGLSEVIAST